MSADFYAYSNFGDLADPFMMVFAIVWIIIALISMALGVTLYILQSTGLYNIAKRRGIHHPGLAWVPIANTWIIGSISDQYQYVVKGKVRNRRKVLLGLVIAISVMMVVTVALFTAGVINSGVMMDTFEASFFVSMGGAFAVYIVMWIVAVVASVFLYIAYYDVYRSCNPGNAVLFLILGIFFDFLQPVFVFICRKKDEGMPPRKVQVPTDSIEQFAQEPVPETPVEEPVTEE